MWKSHVKNSLCWDFFCVNDNKDVDVKCLQTMTCIIWYNNPILLGNAKTQEKIFTIITYNTTNGITTLKKHMNLDHYTIAKMFEEKVNIPLKGGMKRQPIKKNKSNPFVV